MRAILAALAFGLAGCRATLTLEAFVDEAVVVDGRSCVWAVINSRVAPIKPTDSLYLCCVDAGPAAGPAAGPVCNEATWQRTAEGIEIGAR